MKDACEPETENVGRAQDASAGGAVSVSASPSAQRHSGIRNCRATMNTTTAPVTVSEAAVVFTPPEPAGPRPAASATLP